MQLSPFYRWENWDREVDSHGQGLPVETGTQEVWLMVWVYSCSAVLPLLGCKQRESVCKRKTWFWPSWVCDKVPDQFVIGLLGASFQREAGIGQLAGFAPTSGILEAGPSLCDWWWGEGVWEASLGMSSETSWLIMQCPSLHCTCILPAY